MDFLDAIVNQSEPIKVELKGSAGKIVGKSGEFNLSILGERSFHVIYEGGSYSVTVVKVNITEKSVSLLVNGKKATVKLSTELDQLLQRLGMENVGAGKAKDLTAPMPGLIHSILVEEGADVKKGEALLILEAMKMENVIKAQADASVGSIKVKPGDSVEKGELLIAFG